MKQRRPDNLEILNLW